MAAGVAAFQRLREIARRSSVYLWNANLLFDPGGHLINWRRKLVPTLGEKLTYTPGDAAGLTTAMTPLGRIGVLICGENVNTLARFWERTAFGIALALADAGH